MPPPIPPAASFASSSSRSRPTAASASAAIARYRGPVLLVHGDNDEVVPASHLEGLAAIARAARADDPDAAPVETMIVAGGQHSWLYEVPAYRRAVARMLTVACGGPLDPDEAGAVAEDLYNQPTTMYGCNKLYC